MKLSWPRDRKKAFRIAAEAFGTPYEERTREQRVLTCSGFCHAIEKLTDSDSIYRWAGNFRRGTSMVSIGLGYWCFLRYSEYWAPACDKQRSLFCYLMAALSDKEFEEISR